MSQFGYTNEGIGAYVYNRKVAGTTELYRSWNPNWPDHFFTVKKEEHDNAVKNLGFTDEGIACYVFTA